MDTCDVACMCVCACADLSIGVILAIVLGSSGTCLLAFCGFAWWYNKQKEVRRSP